MNEEDPSERRGGLSQTLAIGKGKKIKIRRRGLEDTSSILSKSVPTEFYQKNRLTPPNAPWFGSIQHKDEIEDNFMLPPSPEVRTDYMEEFVSGRSLNNPPSALLSASLPVNFGTNELPNFSNLNINRNTIKNQNTDGSDTASSSVHSGKQEDVEPPTVSGSFTCFELLTEQRGTSTKAEAFTHDFTTPNNNIRDSQFLLEEDEFGDEEDEGIFTLEMN